MENKTITKIVTNSNTLFPLNKTHPYNDNIKYKIYIIIIAKFRII